MRGGAAEEAPTKTGLAMRNPTSHIRPGAKGKTPPRLGGKRKLVLPHVGVSSPLV